MPLLGIGTGRARKASSTAPAAATLRKQVHRRTQPDSRTDLILVAGKSAHLGASQRVPHPVPDLTVTQNQNTQNALRPLITSRPYAIAGVPGFHRGAKPPIAGFSQLERRLKPIPHKNVGSSRVGYSKTSRDMNAPRRHVDGTAAKNLARRIKAVTQVSLSRNRDLLLSQHRNQVDSAVHANIVFGGTSLKGRHNPTESISVEGETTLASTSTTMPARALGPTVAGHNDAGCEAMLAAFGALSLSTAIAAKKRRLPFLRRIVRTSFFRRCRMMGVALDSVSSQTQPLTILYKIPMDLSDNESDNDVTEYSVYEVKLAVDQLLCPLCDTLGRLITKEMLEAHLKWDHVEVEASWRIRKDESWELALELTGDELEVVESEEVPLSYSSFHSSVRSWPPNSELPVSDTDPGEFQTGTHNIATHVEHPVSYFFKFKPESSPTPASSTASLTPAAVGNRLHRAPIAGDPLGPLGVYPYLPSIPTNNDDSLSLSFSCRPCGPRLFDLVVRYPMSDYGLTSWSLLERDEELFEIDDIRDEEKAMQALWNRWIVSRRRGYLMDPCNSVVEFVDAFHPTIIETAGWKGVRVWLLLLAKHRYLTGDDVVTVMRYYERITSIRS